MPAVTEEANAMLTDLQAPERVRVECEKASKDGESVKDDMVIWVSDRRGYEREYATYSGGEKFSLAIALRKAFGELQSVRAVGASDAPILVVDEGWGSLDPERIKTFATVLRRVIQSKRFSLVLVVSHVQDVIDAFETKLLVSQDAEGSTVQVIR